MNIKSLVPHGDNDDAKEEAYELESPKEVQ